MTAPIQDNIPVFKRGASFEAVVRLPSTVEENYFIEWQPLSQIRKEGDMTKEGLIGELTFKWLEPNVMLLSNDETDKWPLGMAEFDILFSSNQGRRIRTKTLRIDIQAGPTQD